MSRRKAPFMNTKLSTLTSLILFTCLFSPGFAHTQGFESRELIDNVFAVTDIENNEEQVVIVSAKGLVVLDSFMSPSSAARFRNAIVEQLKRDDFYYLINMVDRIDLFGGNAAYEDIPIVAHKAFWDKYKDNEEAVNEELSRLIEMWREKENGSSERLKKLEPGSEDAANERRWLELCKARADELESGSSPVLPTEVYEDRKALDLGDITLNLIWFGRTNYDGITVITIPEKKLAIVPGFIMHRHHLAPSPGPEFNKYDVPRWISVFEEILEGENAVEHVLCGTHYTDMWSRERAHTHLRYIRELWNRVSMEEAAGVDLDEIQRLCSMDGDFAFVKEMQPYLDHGDAWIRPQHESHARLFFLQHKNPASEIIENAGVDSLAAALAHIRKLVDEGADIYIEEMAINHIGYSYMRMERYAEAVEVLKLNVDAHPESSNAYYSYAEALMKSGDVEGAIRNYKKSLELNPDNTNAREMLESLR
jgi:tetratricopeptide (TPR) repeat protein